MPRWGGLNTTRNGNLTHFCSIFFVSPDPKQPSGPCAVPWAPGLTGEVDREVHACYPSPLACLPACCHPPKSSCTRAVESWSTSGSYFSWELGREDRGIRESRQDISPACSEFITGVSSFRGDEFVFSGSGVFFACELPVCFLSCDFPGVLQQGVPCFRCI